MLDDVRYPAGTEVAFPFEGKELVGKVDAHQLGGGFVVVKCDNHPAHPLMAIREGLVRPTG